MIEINLLPPEMRRAEATPLPRRLAIFIGTGVISVLVVAVVTLHFQAIPNRRRTLDERKEQRAVLETRVDEEVGTRERFLERARQRQTVAETLRSQQFRWAPVLDEAWRILVAEGTSSWMEHIEVKREDVEVESVVNPRRKTRVPQFVITLQCGTTLLDADASDYERAAKDRIARLFEAVRERWMPLERSQHFYYDYGIGTWEVTEDYRPTVGGMAVRFQLLMAVRPRKPMDEALAMK